MKILIIVLWDYILYILYMHIRIYIISLCCVCKIFIHLWIWWNLKVILFPIFCKLSKYLRSSWCESLLLGRCSFYVFNSSISSSLRKFHSVIFFPSSERVPSLHVVESLILKSSLCPVSTRNVSVQKYDWQERRGWTERWDCWVRHVWLAELYQSRVVVRYHASTVAL